LFLGIAGCMCCLLALYADFFIPTVNGKYN
jgi:hypothetical protein